MKPPELPPVRSIAVAWRIIAATSRESLRRSLRMQAADSFGEQHGPARRAIYFSAFSAAFFTGAIASLADLAMRNLTTVLALILMASPV